MDRKRRFALALILVAIVFSGALLFVWWSRQYPNYLHFQPSVFFSNNFYSLQVSAFVTELRFSQYHMAPGSIDILAFYRAVTLEENFEGRWNLEVLDSVMVNVDNESMLTVNSFSHLFTCSIRKYWVFYRHEPFFTVWVNRTFLFDSENMNSQVIFDVQNQGLVTDGWSWLVYNMTKGVFGYRIDYASPDVVSIQTGHPTESQINFHNASDRDLRRHSVGEQELIRLTVYVDQFGAVADAVRFLVFDE